MYHKRKYWIANGGACFERQLTFFRRWFRIMSAGIALWYNNLTRGNEKSSTNHSPSQSFDYRCFTKLNQKRPLLHFVLFYFIKFKNKPIFDYHNIHLLYGSVWKILYTKEHRNRYNNRVVLTGRDSWLTRRFWISTTEFFVIIDLFTTT